jgi:hypothetical protein
MRSGRLKVRAALDDRRLTARRADPVLQLSSRAAFAPCFGRTDDHAVRGGRGAEFKGVHSSDLPVPTTTVLNSRSSNSLRKTLREGRVKSYSRSPELKVPRSNRGGRTTSSNHLRLALCCRRAFRVSSVRIRGWSRPRNDESETERSLLERPEVREPRIGARRFDGRAERPKNTRGGFPEERWQ